MCTYLSLAMSCSSTATGSPRRHPPRPRIALPAFLSNDKSRYQCRPRSTGLHCQSYHVHLNVFFDRCL
ncbi:hypothetical protein VTN00DRAFT_7326 [Thermoascus crustaceus]|uniref:uncharacterized protein n=1 Tax=Thermoascus crustaceus TaxID=5088 RepID=UPI00374242BF